MFYKNIVNDGFNHIIMFESEDELDKFSYACESDNPNYNLMRCLFNEYKSWLEDNTGDKNYWCELYDWRISFKHKNDALMFKMVWS